MSGDPRDSFPVVSFAHGGELEVIRLPLERDLLFGLGS